MQLNIFYIILQMRNSCPNPMCDFKYDRRSTPNTCPKCKVLLSKEPPSKDGEKKRKKKAKEVNPKHVTVDLGDGLYSVQYHQHNR